jgi:hypothetical protein
VAKGHKKAREKTVKQLLTDRMKQVFDQPTDRLKICLDLVKKRQSEIKKTSFISFLELGGDNLFRVSMRQMMGIYFLWSGYSVVYVGQSKNVYSRVNTHILEGKKRFDYACAINCKQGDLDKMESAFIGLLKPIYNYHRGEYVCNDQQAFLNHDSILESLTIKTTEEKR